MQVHIIFILFVSCLIKKTHYFCTSFQNDAPQLVLPHCMSVRVIHHLKIKGQAPEIDLSLNQYKNLFI